MKGQQITPWSIYNQKAHREEKDIYYDEEKPQNSMMTILPKIARRKKNSIRKYLLPEEGKQIPIKHSLKLHIPYSFTLESTSHMAQNYQNYSQYKNMQTQSDLPYQDLTEALQKEQRQLQKTLEQRLLIKILSEELKKSVFQENEYNESTNIQQIQTKQGKQLSFPKISGSRNLAIFNLNHPKSISSNRVHDRLEVSQEAIKALLKKQIGSMMPNKIRVLGKSKKISIKSQSILKN